MERRALPRSPASLGNSCLPWTSVPHLLTKITASIYADWDGRIYVGVKGDSDRRWDPQLFHFHDSVHYSDASKGNLWLLELFEVRLLLGDLQLLELFEVWLSLCVGAKARMNRVLYICYLLCMLFLVYDLAADCRRNWTNTIGLSLTFLLWFIANTNKFHYCRWKSTFY